MTSFGAHLASGCSVLKEPPTAPKPVPKVDTSSWNSFKFSPDKSLGCSPDPFLWHDHESFLAELSELDSWKNELPCTASKASPDLLSTPTDDAEEWNGILNNMEWIDKFEALDIPSVDSECSSSCKEGPSHSKANTLLEESASLIDWKAWNRYLGSDDEDFELKSENTSVLASQSEDSFSNSTSSRHDLQCSQEPKFREDIEIKVEADDDYSRSASETNNGSNDIKFDEIEKVIIRSSGPLTSLPSVEPCKRDRHTLFYAQSVEEDIKPLKRRGVKMKPPSDEGTNHRRSLNREAAFRYRERKRMEKLDRERELEYLTQRNDLLKLQMLELRDKIASYKEKLDIVHN
ncbi:hypothetical protein Q1695_002332 [Nippostrongylus brasiliensis]|nr:hypothetical protein Q1695_002332 [Nippostrongylus brasiliensis]